MKALFYALFLSAVLVGSVVLLRSIEPHERTRAALGEPVVESRSPSHSGVPSDQIASAPSGELLAMGDELLNLWHVREATELFERVVAADSGSFDGWVRLVECYSDPLICREDDARAAWRSARSAVLADRDTSFVRGLAGLYLDRDYDAAIDAFVTARRAGVDRADLRYHLALSFYRSGRLDEAESQLEDLLTEDDTVGRVVELSIRVMVARNDTAGAATRARQLARMYSEEPFPYVLLAQVDLCRGDERGAVEFCNNALILDPRYIPAILTRGNLYVASGRLEAARVSFEKLLLFDDLILKATGQDAIAFVDFLAGDFGDGASALDEAIRHAIMAGSARRGVSYASRLIAYLCELGQADEAAGVVERWITGFGDAPVQIAMIRVQILRAEMQAARHSLDQIDADTSWLAWSRTLSVDAAELGALADIGEGRFEEASRRFESDAIVGVGAGVRERRMFLRGVAAFEGGDAEGARVAFEGARAHLFGVEFPYRGDPVLSVQSVFFLAEAALAAGDEARARSMYTAFVDAWGGAAWDLPAVSRARAKLETLGEAPAE